MKVTPQHRYIELGDHQKEVPVVFTLEELKLLQGVLLRHIQYLAEEKNEAVKSYDDLAIKLEYFLTEKEKETL